MAVCKTARRQCKSLIRFLRKIKTSKDPKNPEVMEVRFVVEAFSVFDVLLQKLPKKAKGVVLGWKGKLVGVNLSFVQSLHTGLVTEIQTTRLPRQVPPPFAATFHLNKY